jgi:hypothetical protein
MTYYAAHDGGTFCGLSQKVPGVALIREFDFQNGIYYN